ncbi:MAG TPA: HD domain-containing protein [Candidatus Dormibacteraeota bacterium]|nr:HD domain-containing protein [Candidatus Dormibacteraeota bacterium]
MTQRYTSRFSDALTYAAQVHRNQLRKGTEVPYVGHLLGVASIVIDSGGNEDEAIAALLHDAPEDHGGQALLDEIRELFGDRVAEIVEACSDSLAADPAAKQPWRERKEAYVEHVRACTDPSVYLVSAADKLHNCRSSLLDLRARGDRLWERFNPAAGRDGTLWYYHALLDAYDRGPADPRRGAVVDELRRTVEALERESRAQR